MATYEPHPVVLWELTRLCDMRCRGCPSGASMHADPNELSTYEAYKTVDQIAALRPRELAISGGDPLQRNDVYQIIDYARRRGLDPALVLTPTHELTFDTVARLQSNGLTAVVFSVDGSNAAIHESLHDVLNTFGPTLRAMRWAEMTGMRIEVNTLVTRRNADDLRAIAEVIRPFKVSRWNIHFLVPTGASRELEMITAAEAERAFETIEEIRAREAFPIRIIEAPHYRRFRVQRIFESRVAAVPAEWADFTGYEVDAHDDIRELVDAALDGARGFVYVSHSGEVRPSEFAPQSAGNLRYRPLGDIYRGSDLFVALRDPDNLHGRCRYCDFRMLCGGSRARAFSMTGDLFGADPLCSYEPGVHTEPALVSRGRGGNS